MPPDHALALVQPMAAPMVEVTISGLQVAADIGVYAHEHGRPQPLTVDIVLGVAAPARDMLDETVDYQRVADDAHALAQDRTALIETYAMRLAERCIGYSGVHQVEVRVSKPGALRGGLAGARVSLGRPRS